MEKEMTSNVEAVWNIQFRNIPISIGTMISRVSRSLLKRFTMRPLGVVSKKLIGLRITLDRIPMCRTLEAFMAPRSRIREAINTIIPAEKTTV